MRAAYPGKSFTIAAIFIASILLSSSTQAAADSCKFVEPPTTPVELIQNIKCAVALNTFFDDDIFKDDEKLWKLTGGQEFFKNFPMPSHILLPKFQMDRSSVGISHFPQYIDNTNSKTIFRQKLLDFGIGKNVTSTEKTIILDLGNAQGLQLGFDDVVKLFGPDWKRIKEITESSSATNLTTQNKPAVKVKRKLIPAYAIQYQLTAPPSVQTTLIIHFNNDGYLETLEIFLTEKQS